ncbi:MAG: hypothetical protein ACW9W4_02425 [Candidatus Nitrosopumilus sp. bin_7KS]
MSQRKDIIILVIVAISVIMAFFYLDVGNSLFGTIINPLTPVNFDDVFPRNIVKNGIPITLLEQNGDSCKMYGEKFFQIINHTYFTRSQELVHKLQYNHDEHTLIIPCDQITDEKSRLEVWYVVPESDKHATKYAYWITPWEETLLPQK